MSRSHGSGSTKLGSILFQDENQSVIVLDVPRSIEEGQVLPSHLKSGSGNLTRRLVSLKPIDEPYPTPEANDSLGTHAQSLSDLMTGATVGNVLESLRVSHKGPWCLPRLVKPDHARSDRGEPRKRKRSSSTDGGDRDKTRIRENIEGNRLVCGADSEPQNDNKHALRPVPQAKGFVAAARNEQINEPARVYYPTDSSYLHGTIAARRDQFLKTAPIFDLVILDPPWPNRSARRKKDNYNVASDLLSLRKTLSLLPIAAHLAPNGLVAIWVTNKPSIVELLTAPRDGLFAEWDLELEDEWTWLKVTTAGEPIVNVESRWRKPWEKVLIARRRGSSKTGPGARAKVIVSVPDVHSRKPCLQGLFENAFPDGCQGLEVFARNLMAGWWSWGDEVLKFQAAEHWVET